MQNLNGPLTKNFEVLGKQRLGCRKKLLLLEKVGRIGKRNEYFGEK